MLVVNPPILPQEVLAVRYPKFLRLRQQFERPRVEDVAGAVRATLEKLSLEPLLLRMPLVRYQQQLTIGPAHETWTAWYAASKP
jgi:hypothetical protein